MQSFCKNIVKLSVRCLLNLWIINRVLLFFIKILIYSGNVLWYFQIWCRFSYSVKTKEKFENFYFSFVQEAPKENGEDSERVTEEEEEEEREGTTRGEITAFCFLKNVY